MIRVEISKDVLLTEFDHVHRRSEPGYQEEQGDLVTSIDQS